VPQVFVRRHNNELLVAWFWPDGPMWLQPGFGVPVEVTSGEFSIYVQLGWNRLNVPPGTTEVRAVDPAGRLATFELIR
jgi:hypothetical protein